MNDIMDYYTGQKICPECSGRSFHLICGQGYRYALCDVCGWHTGVTEKDEQTIERAMEALTWARTRWSKADNEQEEDEHEGQSNTENT